MKTFLYAALDLGIRPFSGKMPNLEKVERSSPTKASESVVYDEYDLISDVET